MPYGRQVAKGREHVIRQFTGIRTVPTQKGLQVRHAANKVQEMRLKWYVDGSTCDEKRGALRRKKGDGNESRGGNGRELR